MEIEAGKPGRYVFGNCTALEKVTIYHDFGWIDPGSYNFYGCANLKEINLYMVEEAEYDEDGNVIGYLTVSPTVFAYLDNGSLYGLSSISDFSKIPLITEEYTSVVGRAFEGTAFETLVLPNVDGFWTDMYNVSQTFSGAAKLKEVWITPLEGCIVLYEDNFINLANDVNFYFYTMTKDELIEMCGDGWLINADEKAHFYFKDTIPEDVEIPEGVVLPSEEEGTEE